MFLYNGALADVRSTGARIKCLYCTFSCEVRDLWSHPWPGNWVAIGRAVVYYAWAGHAYSTGFKYRHCTLKIISYWFLKQFLYFSAVCCQVYLHYSSGVAGMYLTVAYWTWRYTVNYISIA